MKRVFFLILGMLLSVSNVYAARPLTTADAGTVVPGSFELEYGFEYIDATDREINNSLAITTGLLDNLDLAVEIPYQSIDFEDTEEEAGKTESGMADITVSAKLNIFKGHDVLPDAAVSFSYKDESGEADKGLGTDEVEYGITGIFSKEFKDFTCHFNLGPTIKHDSEDTLNYNFAVERALNEKINLVGEIFGDTVLSGKFHDNATSAQAGINYAVNDAVSLDLGAAMGISKSEPDYRVTTGVTLAFGG
jgi:hypothetical protein